MHSGSFLCSVASPFHSFVTRRKKSIVAMPALCCLIRVTRRRQNKPSNTQEPKQRATQQRTTARSSANLTKLNQTPTQSTLVKDTITLFIPKSQGAESLRTHVARMQGCARMYPVIRRLATKYLHTLTFTTHRGCGSGTALQLRGRRAPATQARVGAEGGGGLRVGGGGLLGGGGGGPMVRGE